jgi:histone H3/H4
MEQSTSQQPTTEEVEEPGKAQTLVLPVPRIDRAIRKAFAGKRVSAGSAVYATAALEAIFAEVVRAAEEKRAGIRKGPKSIDRKILVAAVRTNPTLGKLFRSYTFAPDKSIRVKRDLLLTKADKEAAQKKRAEAKAKKDGKAAVPAVDED